MKAWDRLVINLSDAIWEKGNNLSSGHILWEDTFMLGCFFIIMKYCLRNMKKKKHEKEIDVNKRQITNFARKETIMSD